MKGSVPTAHASFPLSFGFNIGKGRKLKALAYPSKVTTAPQMSTVLHVLLLKPAEQVVFYLCDV